jgi:hypothetical protein
MTPSEIIAWECGSCTFNNEGSEPGPCLMSRTGRPRRCAIVAGATAGDGAGNCAGPPVAQVPVLSAAVAGVAGATARDGAGSRAGPPVAGPPVAQVAKSPALAAEVGAPAPVRKWLTKRAMKSAATARVVSAPTPAEVVPAVAAAAPARRWKTKRAKNVAAGTEAVAVTAEVVSPPAPAEEVLAPAPAAKAPPAAPAPVAVLTAPAPAQKLPMGCILNSVLEVVESSGTFVDPNIVGRGSTRKNAIFSNSLWINSEYPNLLKNMFIWSL